MTDTMSFCRLRLRTFATQEPCEAASGDPNTYSSYPMDDQHPPIITEATPDDVLAILRDQHRQQCTYDWGADPRVVLTRESTIDAWRQACDLIRWRPLATALNAAWKINVPHKQWRSVLEPAGARTVGDVCDLIARYAQLPRVRPVRVLGKECLPAGVFLTVRTYLAAAGADVRNVAPSTPLAEYTRRYAGVFLGPVSQFAPGTLPPVRIRRPIYDLSLLAFMASSVGIGVASCIRLDAVTALCAIVAVVSYLGIWIAARCVLPASVEFQGLRTFRDLCKTVAAVALA